LAAELRLEVAQTPPPNPIVQVDLGDRHLSPFLALGEDLAGVAVDGRDHPVGMLGLVGAADHADVVFGGEGHGQVGVAPPDRPGDHLGFTTCRGRKATSVLSHFLRDLVTHTK